MIFYKETENSQTAYIKCECGTHGIEINKPIKNDSEIYISIMLDAYYSSQTHLFERLKDKIKKIWYILIGKKYRIEDDIVLKDKDINELISVLEKMKKN